MVVTGISAIWIGAIGGGVCMMFIDIYVATESADLDSAAAVAMDAGTTLVNDFKIGGEASG